MKKNFLFKTILIGLIIVFLPSFVEAYEKHDFFIESSYDVNQREELSTFLIRKGYSVDFYIEQAWWEGLSEGKKQAVEDSIRDLDFRFHFDVKPVLNKNYGMERDTRNNLVVLVHEMRKEARGYFRNVDAYPEYQYATSNDNEMVYLNAQNITDDLELLKSYLAHEFTHVITFHHKNQYAVEEETWLNEARAEYAPTLIGANEEYSGSYLEERIKDFLKNPSDSITEWQGNSSDYGALSLFTHYLVDQYGIEILNDSLNSPYVGIESINWFFEENGIDKTFSEAFTDWTITILINDCSLGEEYCYQDENLKDIKVIPLINFLPLSGRGTLGVSQETKEWAGNWFKFLGGRGTLKLEFIGETDQEFIIPYLTQDLEGNYSLHYFELNNFQRGVISISDFGTNIGSITIIPSIQSKTSNFKDSERSYPFFWEVSTAVAIKEENIPYLDKAISDMTREELASKAQELERILRELNDQIAVLDRAEGEEIVFCRSFDENLYFGLTDHDGVRCLQQFLRTQEDIYPEGLVTGNFYTLTLNAVIRFQERHAHDILAPLGLEWGTGFVGSSTRDKLNEFLGL